MPAYDGTGDRDEDYHADSVPVKQLGRKLKGQLERKTPGVHDLFSDEARCRKSGVVTRINGKIVSEKQCEFIDDEAVEAESTESSGDEEPSLGRKMDAHPIKRKRSERNARSSRHQPKKSRRVPAQVILKKCSVVIEKLDLTLCIK